MSLASSTVSAYQVHVDQFDGPLDLLLHLVRESRLDITEISLAAVAQQYFSYLAAMQSLDVEIESSYLLVFAQLLELKSRLLLPPEEEEECGDPCVYEDYACDDAPTEADPLVDRLAAYALVKDAAQWLAQREEESSRCFARPCAMLPAGAPELKISKHSLARVFRRLEYSPRAPRKPYSLDKVVLSVPERIIELWRRFVGHPLARFTELLGGKPTRSMIIVTFLALLELAKQRKVSLHQEKTAGEIEVVKCDEP